MIKLPVKDDNDFEIQNSPNRNEWMSEHICKSHWGEKFPMKWIPLSDSEADYKELV